jgi:tRNA-2-methylthio-N6-dimethylallyladenosine synthase
MRRGYTRAGYLETVTLLRAHGPALALTTDVIVGYPGETESEFEATVSLVEEVAFDGVFVFMYSPRPGTAAVRLADDVPADEKLRRLQVINSMQQRAQEHMNRARIGRREQVLVDTVTQAGRVAGRTRDFRIVHLDGEEGLLGQTLELEITASGPNSLVGRRSPASH